MDRSGIGKSEQKNTVRNFWDKRCGLSENAEAKILAVAGLKKQYRHTVRVPTGRYRQTSLFCLSDQLPSKFEAAFYTDIHIVVLPFSEASDGI